VAFKQWLRDELERSSKTLVTPARHEAAQAAQEKKG